jgi:Uma2 family endonuclease
MTLEAFERFGEKPGYVYELIDGVLNVSPSARIPHEIWASALRRRLERYADEHSDVVNFVATDCDVVIPERPGVTRPRPDLALYRDFPTLDRAVDHPDWEEVCPVLVIEIVSPRRRRKDVIRNRHLYWAATNIAEYWIVDPEKDARRPRLVALRRGAKASEWSEHRVEFGQPYKTPALPGFVMNLADMAS